VAKSLSCPACKFPNFLGAEVCLLCKTSLDGILATEIVPDDQVPSETTLGYLCCYPFPPVPLKRGDRFVFGRTRSADIVLPHHSVSRRHGEIRVAGDKIVYEDLSSNGSFLNGKRLSGEVTLRVGDMLTIGPYDLELTLETEGAGVDRSRTSELDFSSLISGLLEETSIYEVLQGLEYNAKSGTLSILSGRLRGALVVREGKPWFANLGDLRDDEAVLKMLELTEGRFIFSNTVEDGSRSMQSRLTALLLEGSRQQDELTTHTDLDPPTEPR
jgi:pSer/pThr/pTyr-binding forkhead associated (FHA) protein